MLNPLNFTQTKLRRTNPDGTFAIMPVAHRAFGASRTAMHRIILYAEAKICLVSSTITVLAWMSVNIASIVANVRFEMV